MDKPLITTADVPPKFLKAAFLVGLIPHKALASDPRVSYTLYVPPEHYVADPSGGVGQDTNLAKLPLLVYVHGTRRDFYRILDELIEFANSTPCAVLLPLFPVGLDGPHDIDSYKLLRSATLRSDLALLSMLDEVARRWPGVETGRVFMMGFSGGGQFAHRFLYLYPERLAAVSVGAPGRATLLDRRPRWPVGVADVRDLFGRDVEKELVAQVRIQLVVGDADVDVHGGEEFWTWLRQVKGKLGGEGDRSKGGGENALKPMEEGRVKTLRNLQSMWKQDGIEAQLDVVQGAAHDVRKVHGCVLTFLRPLMQVHKQA